MQLARPEISLEGRAWSEDREGVASNQSSLGFLSFVLPRQKWSIAIYVQTLSSLEFPTQWTTSDGELDPLSSLVIGNFGVSAALRLSDTVSIGFGLTAFAGVFSEGSFNPDSVEPFWDDNAQSDAGATAGVLWSLTDTWALGASYRSGADFTFEGGGRATIPDILAAGARWQSSGRERHRCRRGRATLAESTIGPGSTSAGSGSSSRPSPSSACGPDSGTTPRAAWSQQARTASSSRPGAWCTTPVGSVSPGRNFSSIWGRTSPRGPPSGRSR